MSKTSVDNLANEINKALTEFAGVTEEACESGVMDTAQDAVKDLRPAQPTGTKGDPAGVWGSWSAYNRGWKIKTQKRKGETTATIHNATHYRLTHLLEKGHVIKNGTGRTFGRTGAYPHIAPVNDWTNQELPNLVKRKLEQ